MRGTIRDYILACEADGMKREAEERKTSLLKQSNCKHERLSRAVHCGNGHMSQYCMDCDKNFSYYDRD